MTPRRVCHNHLRNFPQKLENPPARDLSFFTGENFSDGNQLGAEMVRWMSK